METMSSIMQMNGYEPKTTFWMDFSIADAFGAEAVKDTFKRSFRDWKSNHIFLTELVMVLNHKIWQYYETRSDLATLYDFLWRTADQWAVDNLKGEELEYFYRILD